MNTPWKVVTVGSRVLGRGVRGAHVKKRAPVLQCKIGGCHWQGRAPDTSESPKCPRCNQSLIPQRWNMR